MYRDRAADISELQIEVVLSAVGVEGCLVEPTREWGQQRNAVQPWLRSEVVASTRQSGTPSATSLQQKPSIS